MGIKAPLTHKGLFIVSKTSPYYSDTPEDRQRYVYHDHDDCEDGKRILARNKKSGTGGRPRCDACIRLG